MSRVGALPEAFDASFPVLLLHYGEETEEEMLNSFLQCTWKSRDLTCRSLISSAKKFRTVGDGRTTIIETAIVDRILWFAAKKNSIVAEEGEEDEERRGYRTSRDVSKRREWCVHRKKELVITSESSVSIMAGNGLNSETPDVRIEWGRQFSVIGSYYHNHDDHVSLFQLVPPLFGTPGMGRHQLLSLCLQISGKICWWGVIREFYRHNPPSWHSKQDTMWLVRNDYHGPAFL